MQTEPFVTQVGESDTFVEIVAASREQAEREFGAVFDDQPEDEAQHG